MNKLKRHLSVANVLSLTALFVALSASAYAAVRLQPGQVKAVNIAKQAVTNPKIKQQAVTSGKIKNGGVVTADLGAGAVTSEKLDKRAVINSRIANGAVGTNKLANDAVTTAKLGAESATTGKLGNESVTAGKLSASLYRQLLKNVSYVTETSPNNTETEKSVTALCPTGKEAIGGGARINSAASVEVAVTGSYPDVTASNSRIGWIATGKETPAEAGDWQVVAYVICAEL